MSMSARMVRSGVAAVRGASRGLATPAGAAVAVSSRRTMTTFQERERGEEAVFMRKEDKKLLENLLKKEKAAHGKDGRAELLEILGSHKLPDSVIDSLLRWKTS